MVVKPNVVSSSRATKCAAVILDSRLTIGVDFNIFNHEVLSWLLSGEMQNDMIKHFQEDLSRRLLSLDFKKQVDGLDLLQKVFCDDVLVPQLCITCLLRPMTFGVWIGPSLSYQRSYRGS